MRVLHICYSDLEGGAARAAYRLHKAQRKQGIDSIMLVINKVSDDPYVFTLNKLHLLRIKIQGALSNRLLKLQRYDNAVHHSLNIFPSGLIKNIDAIDPDIVNLHWLGGEMISIGEIANISQPLVWTLHDMWAFNGCEHYDSLSNPGRYKNNYVKSTVNPSLKGLDLNRYIYNIKTNKWKSLKVSVVTPSNWLAECVRSSRLLRDQKLEVISNCIDHDRFSPIDKNVARNILGLNTNKKYLLFGAMSSVSDQRKGYHLLSGALKKINNSNKYDNLELLVFGASHGGTEFDTGIKTHYMGRVYDDTTLNLLYCAADVFVAPSLQDNLPNTLVESFAVGTPCISFDIGGFPDLISDNSLGTLLPVVGSSELAEGICNTIEREFFPSDISERSKAMRSEEVIVNKYLDLYESTISG